MRAQPFRLWLFTVRLWQEPLDNTQIEWRGEVRNTSSGESRYFRNWPMLTAQIVMMLSEAESHTTPDSSTNASSRDPSQ